MRHLLLIEDDLDLGRLIEGELQNAAFQVSWAKSLLEADGLDKKFQFDLAVVDLMLPDGRGFEFVKKSQCPILMMSALSDPANRLEGMELGAIDFIPKPFLIKELLLKIQRALPAEDEVWSLGDVQLDMTRRKVLSGSETLFLNRRDFKILQILIESQPQVVSRDTIIDKVYGQDQNPSHRSIDNAIVGIRQLLKDKDHTIIRSVRGEGYQWGREK